MKAQKIFQFDDDGRIIAKTRKEKLAALRYVVRSREDIMSARSAVTKGFCYGEGLRLAAALQIADLQEQIDGLEAAAHG
jgi:hypothetical protein